MSIAAPAGDRHMSIDTLRGVASLGILVMNIVAFGLPPDSYLSPMEPAAAGYAGPFSGANAAFWWIQHLFFDQKMMSIFSMLFGAGLIVLDTRHRSRSGAAASLAAIYYRRISFLLLLGLLHAFILWYGDILTSYALCGLGLYPMRRLRPGVQIAIASVLLCIGTALMVGMGALMSLAPVAANGASEWAPTVERVDAQVAAFRGTFAQNIAATVENAIVLQTLMFIIWTSWRAGAMMLLGMALMQTGFFSAQWSAAAYRRTVLISLLVGMPLTVASGLMSVRHGFNMAHMFLVDMPLNQFGSTAIAIGYCALIMLLHQSGALAGLRTRLAAVGQIGLTSYLAQTLLCTTIFYGRGLGYFGHFERAELVFFVLGVWAVLLVACPWWVARFRYGPVEWLWRSVTYLSVPPIRRVAQS